MIWHIRLIRGMRFPSTSMFQSQTQNLLRSMRGYQKNGLQHFPKRGPMSWLHGYGLMYGGGALAVFISYYMSCLETVPYTNRRHSIMFVSRSQELALGRAIFEQTKSQARLQGNLLPDNHPTVQLVKRVGSRVAIVASSPAHSMTVKQGWLSEDAVMRDQGYGDQEHMKDIGWEFAVIRSPVPNAFVVPGILRVRSTLSRPLTRAIALSPSQEARWLSSLGLWISSQTRTSSRPFCLTNQHMSLPGIMQRG